ncbi:MAG: dihydroxyacetone kinase phosphoryl donor subunit DhaM [Rubrobacteraceae bacterium]
MTVALVLVSHSPQVAEGTADIVRQMAGEIEVLPVGGDSEGGFGTDPEKIQTAMESAGAEEVLVFMDLGSAVLSAETVLDMLSAEDKERVWLVDAPFVEGAFSAGVAASAGDDAEACIESAMEAQTESKLH